MPGPVEGYPEGPRRSVEGSPELEIPDSWWNTISKYAGDYFFPPEVADPLPPMIVFTPAWMGGGQVSGLTREEFFRTVKSHFSSIPWTTRASRAREISRGAGGIQISDEMYYWTPETLVKEKPFMEQIEQSLISKFAPDLRSDSTYRMKREAERREGQIKEFTPRAMSKTAFLEDLQNRIGSVQWREKASSHKATVTSRPGLRKQLQEELNDGSY